MILGVMLTLELVMRAVMVGASLRLGDLWLRKWRWWQR